MKTVKYFICIDNLEIDMCNKMEISKAEYTTQLKFMREQVEKTIDYETPITEKPKRVYEHASTIETIISFRCACAVTDLIILECKDGYYFKTKKQMKKGA